MLSLVRSMRIGTTSFLLRVNFCVGLLSPNELVSLETKIRELETIANAAKTPTGLPRSVNEIRRPRALGATTSACKTLIHPRGKLNGTKLVLTRSESSQT